jgi:hypothetical protein
MGSSSLAQLIIEPLKVIEESFFGILFEVMAVFFLFVKFGELIVELKLALISGVNDNESIVYWLISDNSVPCSIELLLESNC